MNIKKHLPLITIMMGLTTLNGCSTLNATKSVAQELLQRVSDIRDEL